MTRTLRTRIGSLALIGALVVSGCIGESNPTASPDRSISSAPPTSVAPSISASAAPAAPPSEPQGKRQRVDVVRVIDGDTIVIAVRGRQERVRYIGMDAPERGSEGQPGEPFATEATKANRKLVGRSRVVLETDTSERDRNGRLLRHVWLRDGKHWTLVGWELVHRGLAEAHAYPPDLRYQDQLDAAEAAAQEAGVGIWGADSSGTAEPSR